MKTLCTIIISLLVLAGTAQASTINGHEVGVIQVGNIGNKASIISLTFDGAIYSDHQVYCLHPRRLHVVSIITFRHHKYANVFACSNYHHWRLP